RRTRSTSSTSRWEVGSGVFWARSFRTSAEFAEDVSSSPAANLMKFRTYRIKSCERDKTAHLLRKGANFGHIVRPSTQMKSRHPVWLLFFSILGCNEVLQVLSTRSGPSTPPNDSSSSRDAGVALDGGHFQPHSLSILFGELGGSGNAD